MQLQVYYLVTVLLVVAILQIFKKQSQDHRFKFLLFLAAINAIAYVVNWWYFYLRSDNILTLLPLQLCNLAVFLIPAALLTKKHVLMDFVFYICGLGALVAILVPGSDYSDTYSMMTISFYVFHVSIFLIPIFSSVWDFHSLQPSIKSAISLSGLVLIISGSLHLFNLYLNIVYQIPANYFFTMRNLAAPINPAFALFASWIPFDYFYLIVAFPILYVYMSLVSVLIKVTAKFENA
jgi:uncharacterized membrane protein YwaF